MSTIKQGTELPNLILCDVNPKIGLGVAGTFPNQLLIRTDIPSIYYFKGPLDTDWELLGTSGGNDLLGTPVVTTGPTVLPITPVSIQLKNADGSNRTEITTCVIWFSRDPAGPLTVGTASPLLQDYSDGLLTVGQSADFNAGLLQAGATGLVLSDATGLITINCNTNASPGPESYFLNVECNGLLAFSGPILVV